MEVPFPLDKVVISFVVVGLIGLLVRLYNALVLKPQRLRSILKEQGINGPPPAFLLGNITQIRNFQSSKFTITNPPLIHNCAALLFPFFDQWRMQYGDVFSFSLGNIQILCANEAQIVKEITTCTSLDFGKPSYQQKERGPLLGQGILTSNGSIWSHQRKILAPELYMDKVKGMIDLITESANILVNAWKTRIGTEAEIKIDDGLRSFSGDVISRACFGSNYSKGENIFLKLRSLQEAMSEKSLSMIPGMRYVPSKRNRKAWALEREIRDLILQVVKQREEEEEDHAYDDLLQTVLKGAKAMNMSPEATNRFVVDNCKNIYLAGFETTAVSATWTLMLLAANQDWQDRVRAEVLEVFGGRMPDADMLRKLKLLNMVILESLRLYPPVSVVSREALKDLKLGSINVPKGVNIWTTVLHLHTDPEIWGPDSYNFNPQRFLNGITNACKYPFFYMPFGVGPRVCLGQNLAMVELKILVALIVSNFSFSLSPNYIHSPAIKLVIEPEQGVPLLFNKL